MTRKHQRLIFIVIAMLCLAGATALILYNFRSNLVFFYSPTELKQAHITDKQRIRIGGLVQKGSLTSPQGGNSMQFVLTDMQEAVTVNYTGMLPNLFREGQGMVANGYLQPDGTFRAEELLAKHDEKYMPKEVADALKRSGRWKPEEAK